MKCLLLKNNRNLRKSNASAQKLFLNSDRSGNNNGMENCHCCSEFYLSNMHYMHDKMIGKGVLYHNWHYSVNTWTMYARSRMQNVVL